MKYSHPLATVINCTRKGSIIQTQIRLDRTEGSQIAPATLWVGDPPSEPEAHGVLQLHRLVARTGTLFEFETLEEYEPQSVLPSESSRYYFVGWWGKDQLTLAQSEPKNLSHYFFVSNSPGDHDHCFLCWKTISENEGNDHEGYRSGNDSLCVNCYDKYIVSGFGKQLGDAA